jgi:hypothetical protein
MFVFFFCCFVLTATFYMVEYGAGFFEPEYTFSFSIPQKFNATYVRYRANNFGNVEGDYGDHALPFNVTGQGRSGLRMELFVNYFIDTQDPIIGENVDPLPQLKEVGERTTFVFEVDGRGEPVYLLGLELAAPAVWICIDSVISVLVFAVVYGLFFASSSNGDDLK